MARYRITAAALFAAVLALPLAVPAASVGLAYDSVTKFAMNADPSSLQPGDFDQDFATAAAVQAPEQNTGGGIFSQMRNAMALGQSMQQMMKAGFAERRYVAGSKERIDTLSMQTATIVDCAARTITTLDLRRKTYKTVSMDQSSSSGGGGGPSGSGLRDDGTRIAITVTNSTLGSRQIGGRPTSGYRADMTITETSASGESHTQNGNMVAYYSSDANPAANCSRIGGASAAMRSPALGNYLQVMRALAAGGMDKRFTVKQSGPPLPLDRLAMFSAVTFAGGQGSGMTFITERGNVRSISASDPVFAIPADFTQQQ